MIEGAVTRSERWVATWLDAVVEGRLTMSQRRVTSIAKFGGGLEAATAMAIARGVHHVFGTDCTQLRFVAKRLAKPRS